MGEGRRWLLWLGQSPSGRTGRPQMKSKQMIYDGSNTWSLSSVATVLTEAPAGGRVLHSGWFAHHALQLVHDPGCFPVLPACTRQGSGPQVIRSPGLCALAPSGTLRSRLATCGHQPRGQQPPG